MLSNRQRLAQEKSERVGECMWYLLCTNRATGTQAHPILGDVPICDRCKDQYDKLSAR